MLSDLQLEQLLFCLTGLSPKISVKDLDVKTRSQLKPGSKFKWRGDVGIIFCEHVHVNDIF